MGMGWVNHLAPRGHSRTIAAAGGEIIFKMVMKRIGKQPTSAPSCRRFRRWIETWPGLAPALRRAVATHAAVCPGCARRLVAARRLETLLGRARVGYRALVSRSTLAEVMARGADRRPRGQPSRQRRPRMSVPPALLALGSAVVLLALSLTWLVSSRFAPPPMVTGGATQVSARPRTLSASLSVLGRRLQAVRVARPRPAAAGWRPSLPAPPLPPATSPRPQVRSASSRPP